MSEDTFKLITVDSVLKEKPVTWCDACHAVNVPVLRVHCSRRKMAIGLCESCVYQAAALWNGARREEKDNG